MLTIYSRHRICQEHAIKGWGYVEGRVGAATIGVGFEAQLYTLQDLPQAVLREFCQVIPLRLVYSFTQAVSWGYLSIFSLQN
jgi:hypothetical protein